jgi:serine/threonine protein kinase
VFQGALLAVKQLFSTAEKDFRIECDFLESITSQKHPNTMPLLATYKFGGRYHLLFPWASGNLREYWRSNSMPNWNQPTCIWFLKQVYGLVSALEVIHNFKHNHIATSESMQVDFGRLTAAKILRPTQLQIDASLAKYGRHGDLKPENILRLEDGTLQVADFGLGRFHRLESRSKVDPESVGGSPTYSPPEVAVGEKVSRAYDIWSLGCIFLEFITWLSGGFDGLKSFVKRRDEMALDGVLDDTFYTLKAEDVRTNKPTAIVRQAVSEQIRDLREAPRRSKMVLEFLNVIEQNMLVIDSKKRITAKDLLMEVGKMLKEGSKAAYLVGNDNL